MNGERVFVGTCYCIWYSLFVSIPELNYSWLFLTQTNLCFSQNPHLLPECVMFSQLICWQIVSHLISFLLPSGSVFPLCAAPSGLAFDGRWKNTSVLSDFTWWKQLIQSQCLWLGIIFSALWSSKAPFTTNLTTVILIQKACLFHARPVNSRISLLSIK